jgi:hypothetical protein
VPTVVVATVAFGEMGQDTARTIGLAGMPIVAVPHPIDRMTRVQCEEAANSVYAETVEALTEPREHLESIYATKRWISPAEAVISCSIGAH